MEGAYLTYRLGHLPTQSKRVDVEFIRGLGLFSAPSCLFNSPLN